MKVEMPRSCVVVLGCRPDSAAFVRRAHAAREAFFSEGARMVMACGGRAWNGVVEADALARLLLEGDVPKEAVIRERCSLDTRDNARFAAELLARRDVRDVLVVTCSWHLPRALRLFRRAGLDAEGAGVDPPNASFFARTYWAARERFSTWKDLER
jgi:uncharacterized SAM-binding protein YcdF (DUF218 family)